MSYTLVIYDEREWHKDCAKISKSILRNIVKRIAQLKKEPWPTHVHVKQLHGYPVADFRLRIGDYRVLFNKNDAAKTIYLLRILHRSKLY